MSSKFHVNMATGAVGMCKKAKCSLVSDENAEPEHYENYVDARDESERLLTEKYGPVNVYTSLRSHDTESVEKMDKISASPHSQMQRAGDIRATPLHLIRKDTATSVEVTNISRDKGNVVFWDANGKEVASFLGLDKVLYSDVPAESILN